MKRPVIAIGLDAADPVLLEKWMSQGHLRNLQRLRDKGSYGRLTNQEYYKAETPWTTFLTGCLPIKTGYWSPIKFHEGSYQAEVVNAYDFKEFPPFYALGDDYRVAVFDMPQSTLSDDVNGLQVLAWGAHSPQTPSHSQPASLLKELHQAHGEHPALHKDHGDWWDDDYLQRLQTALVTGIQRRVAICRDLLHRESWDLFLTIFSETHSAGHDFWFLSQPDHPLYQQRQAREDAMLAVFEKVDQAIGDIVTEAPQDANIVVFAAHGSDNNNTDVPSMILLAELLYRYSFPGQTLLPSNHPEATVPPLQVNPQRLNWQEEIWRGMYHPNLLKRWLRKWAPDNFNRQLDRIGRKLGQKQTLLSNISRPKGKLVWQPVMWYHQYWSQMKAFALPSFSEGYIRINLSGREPNGVVAIEKYDEICNDLIQKLYELVNPRTGKPVVKKVVRTRSTATDNDPKLPDADLVVIWHEQPTDVFEHPSLGRVGPVPYRRTGSHRPRGFLTVCGPDIEAGTSLPDGHGVDLAPTILHLMNAPIPSFFDGHSLVTNSVEPAAMPFIS